MKQNYNNTSSRQRRLLSKLQKLQQRLQKRLDNGTFATLNSKKRFQLLKRLRRNALQLQQLGFSFRNVVAGSALALALSFGNVATAQTFTEQIGVTNPFNTADVGLYSSPTFIDIDNDGDFDAFIGEFDGIINYYENTGTNVAPTFVEQTGANNPFNGEDVGSASSSTFIDIDNDGDFDAFIGESDGTINYYQNTSPVLPVELTSFTAQIHDNQTNLQWQTATEENNEGFEVQRSVNGEEWETLDFIKGNGTTVEVQNYTYTDEMVLDGVNYYRLKQVDFDGAFEYSEIVNVELGMRNEELKIYPSPVQDELTIQHGKGIVTVFNLLGQPVREFVINNEQSTINVGDLAKGHYILSIIKNDGTTISKRFVKQ